jgi:hypothetical protein
VLLLLDLAGAKMSQLGEVVSGRLEEGYRALAKAVPKHVLLRFHSRDPQVSLEPVTQGPDVESEEAAQAGVQDATKLVATQFEHQDEDA